MISTKPPATVQQLECRHHSAISAAATRPRRHRPIGAGTSRHPRRAVAQASAVTGSSTPQQQNAASLDVSGAVVQPAFRQTPWAAEAAAAAAGSSRSAVRIAFVSESGICRCVLAAAAFQAALQSRAPSLAAMVEVECRSTKDYCVGEGPDPLVTAVASELGLAVPQGYAVQQFKESIDIVDFDVVLVMDKFTAADVLREVSVFDTIKTWGKANYSSKVRRLGEFNPAVAAAAAKDQEAADIQDALYGNVGGNEELQAVRQAAAVIQQSCEGLVEFLVAVEARHQQEQAQQQSKHAQQAQQQQHESSNRASMQTAPVEPPHGGVGSSDAAPARLGDSLTAAVRKMGAMDWLVPPMLQAR